MNPRIIAAIGGGAIVAIAVISFSYSQVYQQRCLDEGGVVTGFLSCTSVISDFASVDDFISSKYDVEYDDLVTRKVWAFAIPAKEIIPERNCHKFSQSELANLPSQINYVIEQSLPKYPRDNDNDGFYDGFQHPVPFEIALPFLEKYDFRVTSQTIQVGMQKIPDTKYHFECIFEDENFQYKLGFVFNSHYDVSEKIVFVNFTRNDNDTPIIKNKDIIIFTGGFNGTVFFNNKLNHDITLEIQSPPPYEEWSEHLLPTSVTIPEGKFWSHSFRNFHSSDDLIYNYTVIPEETSGSITLKNYPRCMTETEVKSLYSQVGAYPKFPSYLPEGYSFECGVHNFNAYVHLVYFTDELHQKFKDNVNAAFDREFFANGGIRVDYYNKFILNGWTENPNYNKYQEANKYSNPKATTLTIGDHPAVMIKEHFWEKGEQKSFNELTVYSDNEIWYTVRSGLPESEVIKIAESLFVS